MQDEEKKQKILMLCSRSVTVAYFRMNLIADLIQAGYDVTVAPLDRDREEEIRAAGADFVCVEGENRSLNPLKQLKQIRAYRKLIRDQKPDVVFCFQAVPNMLGGIAAGHLSGACGRHLPSSREGRGVRLFCMVEGAGDVFAKTGLKWTVARLASCFLYRLGFRKAEKVIFLNEDDREEFEHRKLIRKEQGTVIRGVGVDLEKFSYEPIRNESVFLMVSRLMETKGTLDYCEAARIAKKQRPQARFQFLGEEFTLKQKDIQEYIDDGSLEYLGYSKDVPKYLKEASVFVLPSFYREGLPMTIMEAMATGRPVITTETVGCKGTVVRGGTGWYVRMKDPQDLAKKMIYAIDHPTEVREMGEYARKYAEEFYDVKKVNERIVTILEGQ